MVEISRSKLSDNDILRTNLRFFPVLWISVRDIFFHKHGTASGQVIILNKKIFEQNSVGSANDRIKTQAFFDAVVKKMKFM